ncbi:TIGR03620 family F420-dependent LLM class oxidoreductase [Novosphingobium barchaimii]|uniref:TIGR03620 family F420-dependent LLM class oxidoreductase n=1 Tax=Novosphingobium barchaimii TaxID=1420591 RepID=UPI000740D735|nr:TIGR03620 family F420-dependent LLM class oxidoreductase [Novosphingobium barchaimii]
MNPNNTQPHLGLGRIGLWSMELRFGDPDAIVDAATELDELGYGTLWIPGAMGGDLLGDLDRLLGATGNATIASGILNIWKHEAADVATWWNGLPAEHRERFLLGLGVSHGATVGEAYRKPLSAMKDYLTQLGDAGVPGDRTCLAALGPKMVELARDRTLGAHPYLVTPEHTAIAREALGAGPLLAPEQGVVFEANRERARDIARPYVQGYGRLENYANSWRRLGFSEEDIATTSDRLVDALFACGDTQVIGERVDAHFAAGADHVCLQVVGPNPGANDVRALLPAWRELAPALIRT